MAGSCEKADCTVATTGKCLLSVADPAECKFFRAIGASASPTEQDTKAAGDIEAGAAPSESSQGRRAARTFHAGIELGTVDAAEILRRHYGHLIAVLGSTDVGKTCFLCSLYLMASNGLLPKNYIFAGSLSLQAFEDRVRGLREWEDGKLPNQLVDHTHRDLDKRQPSLLHWGLRETSGDRRRFDLLLTDLPGEWTDNLVKHASAADGFRFLSRADGIILVVDGKLLLADDSRHVVKQEMMHFIDRLAVDVRVGKDTPFVLLVNKSDETELQVPDAAKELRTYIENSGYRATLILSAAFSRTPGEIPNGLGVFEAIETILSDQEPLSSVTSGDSQDAETRAFGRFRG